MSDTLITLGKDDFPIGSSVTLIFDDGTLALEVHEASELTEVDSSNRGNREPFSLILKGQQDLMLEQAMYNVEIGDKGQHPLFIVPLGPGEEGQLFEVIFN